MLLKLLEPLILLVAIFYYFYLLGLGGRKTQQCSEVTHDSLSDDPCLIPALRGSYGGTWGFLWDAWDQTTVLFSSNPYHFVFS